MYYNGVLLNRFSVKSIHVASDIQPLNILYKFCADDSSFSDYGKIISKNNKTIIIDNGICCREFEYIRNPWKIKLYKFHGLTIDEVGSHKSNKFITLDLTSGKIFVWIVDDYGIFQEVVFDQDLLQKHRTIADDKKLYNDIWSKEHHMLYTTEAYDECFDWIFQWYYINKKRKEIIIK